MLEQIARNKRRTVLSLGVFVLTWLGIGATIGVLFAATGPSTAGNANAGSDVLIGLAVATLAATAGILFTLHSGSGLVLAVAGATLTDRRTHPQLYHLVEALALGDGLPTPAIYVVDDPSPNAFATGSDPAHAAVTVTTGLLALMNREELEGVLAHEMSHIRNHWALYRSRISANHDHRALSVSADRHAHRTEQPCRSVVAPTAQHHDAGVRGTLAQCECGPSMQDHLMGEDPRLSIRGLHGRLVQHGLALDGVTLTGPEGKIFALLGRTAQLCRWAARPPSWTSSCSVTSTKAP